MVSVYMTLMLAIKIGGSPMSHNPYTINDIRITCTDRINTFLTLFEWIIFDFFHLHRKLMHCIHSDNNYIHYVTAS